MNFPVFALTLALLAVNNNDVLSIKQLTNADSIPEVHQKQRPVPVPKYDFNKRNEPREEWPSKELKNEVRQHDAVTYDLGTPRYQILNPDDLPEVITSDHPDYYENLKKYGQLTADDEVHIASKENKTSGKIATEENNFNSSLIEEYNSAKLGKQVPPTKVEFIIVKTKPLNMEREADKTYTNIANTKTSKYVREVESDVKKLKPQALNSQKFNNKNDKNTLQHSYDQYSEQTEEEKVNYSQKKYTNHNFSNRKPFPLFAISYNESNQYEHSSKYDQPPLHHETEVKNHYNTIVTEPNFHHYMKPEHQITSNLPNYTQTRDQYKKYLQYMNLKLKGQTQHKDSTLKEPHKQNAEKKESSNFEQQILNNFQYFGLPKPESGSQKVQDYKLLKHLPTFVDSISTLTASSNTPVSQRIAPTATDTYRTLAIQLQDSVHGILQNKISQPNLQLPFTSGNQPLSVRSNAEFQYQNPYSLHGNYGPKRDVQYLLPKPLLLPQNLFL